MAQTTDAINFGDLSGFYDQHMQDVVQPNANKGIPNEATCSTAAATAAKTVTAPASFSLVSGATILVTFTNGISVDNATLAVGSTAAKPIYYKGAALEADYVEAGDVIMLRYDGTSYNVVGKLGGRALPEVQIGGSTPTSESEIKLYVDESGTDPVLKYKTNNSYQQLIQNYTAGDGIDITSNAVSVDETVARLATAGQGVILPEFVPGIFTGSCSTAASTAAKTLDITGYELVRKSGVAVKFNNGISVASATLNISSKGAKPIYYKGSVLGADVVKANDIVTMVYNGTQYEVIAIESAPKYDRIYVAIASPTGNPATQGWYELSNGEYVLTSDTTVTSGKTYYKQTDYYSMTI